MNNFVTSIKEPRSHPCSLQWNTSWRQLVTSDSTCKSQSTFLFIYSSAHFTPDNPHPLTLCALDQCMKSLIHLIFLHVYSVVSLFSADWCWTCRVLQCSVLTSLAAFGSDTQEKVMSHMEATSAGVRPNRAPSWMNRSHWNIAGRNQQQATPLSTNYIHTAESIIWLNVIVLETAATGWWSVCLPFLQCGSTLSRYDPFSTGWKQCRYPSAPDPGSLFWRAEAENIQTKTWKRVLEPCDQFSNSVVMRMCHTVYLWVWCCRWSLCCLLLG